MTSPGDGDLLGRAARALRDDADAASAAAGGADGRDPIESWQAMDDWRQINRDVRRQARRRRLGVLLALQLLVGLAGVGAWAAVSGRLAPLLFGPAPAARRAAPVSPARTHAARPRHQTVAVAEPAAVEPIPQPAVVERPPALIPSLAAAPRPPVPSPPPPPPGPDPDELYGRAHRAQFALHDYVAALAFWDAYLATGRGSLVPEARWNRAIALVRLGRREAAMGALAPFAAGENEGYRQEEAQALLRVLEAAPH